MFYKNGFYVKTLCFILVVMSVLLGTGYYLDRAAERQVYDTYVRDSQGIIQGLQSISVIQGNKRAVLFVHGFADSPDAFSQLVSDIKPKINSDIYVPLLPFHGRDLASASRLDNQVMLDDLNQMIHRLAKQYQELTIVGMSYGGALVSVLASEHKIPAHAQVILYAPAIFLKGNTLWGRAKAYLYSGWRNYCDYSSLGCGFPSYQSGDTSAKPMFDKERSLHYVVIPALLKVYGFDLENRSKFAHIHRPYSLIIAVDDNRVSYEANKAVCEANQPYCHLYSFSSGKHMIHWGTNKSAFENLLVELIKME